MRLLDTDQGVLKRMNERVRTQAHANNVCNDIFVDLKCETYLSGMVYQLKCYFSSSFFKPKNGNSSRMMVVRNVFNRFLGVLLLFLAKQNVWFDMELLL